MATHEDSFEERNMGENSVDQADFRMQQHLRANGYVQNATEKQIKEHNLAGSYSKIGVDPKDGFVPNFWLVSEVIVLPDYIVYPQQSDWTYLCEVKGTNKLKQEDFAKLLEMQERSEVVNDKSPNIKLEVGLYYFPNPSTNKIGKYIPYSTIEEQWNEIDDYKQFPEKDWTGRVKYYKEMPWTI